MKNPILLLSLLPCWLAACAGLPGAERYRLEPDISYTWESDPFRSGDLYRPVGAGPWPAVLVIHGGSWTRGKPDDMKKFAERFAHAGYLVFNIRYRLAPEHTFPAQLEDVRAALAWLHVHAAELDIDPNRIATMGYSAGGHLALLLALTDHDGPRPAVVASGSGPTDLLAYPKSPLIRDLIGGGPEQYADLWSFGSPIRHASADDPPVMLYHGARDKLVGIDQARRLRERLQQLGVKSELLEQPWSGHATTFLFDWDSFPVVLDFFGAALN